MQAPKAPYNKSFFSELTLYFWMAIGCFLAAFSVEVFLVPNSLIDGGIVGVSMILGNVFGTHLIPFFLLAINFPFLVFAYRAIGRSFLIHMIMANILFALSLIIIANYLGWHFEGDKLEVVVIGGAILGVGLGLIIREGGCIDATEILGIVLNKRTGFTVGQVVLFCNIFIFGGAGLLFQDWHPPILSLITYMVASKVMDAVIVGLDETKSVIIISKKPKVIADEIIHQLELGLTIMYGRGGFTGAEQEILYVITERLQLADLKELVFRHDPHAFLAIENLHEVANGMQGYRKSRGYRRIERLVSQILKSSK